MKRFILLAIALLIGISFVGATELADYGNSTTFTVNNTPWVGTMSNYPIKYILSNASGISGYYGSDNVVYTNGTTRADWADIRPTDGSGNTLSFWPETNTQTEKNLTVWVKHTTIEVGNTTQAKWYYGNSSQSTGTGNGYNVCLLFDDFPGTSLNTTQWYSYTAYGSTSISGGIATIASTYWDYYYLQSTSAFSFGRNTSLRQRYKSLHHSSGTYFENPGWSAGGAGYNAIGAIFSAAGGGSFDTWSGGGSIWSGYTANTWYVVDMDRNFSTNMFRINNALDYTVASGNAATYKVSYETASASSGATQYVDWVCVRPYYSPEPFTSNYMQTSNGLVSSFTSNVSTGAAPLAVKLTDTSSGSPTGWKWSVTNTTPGNNTPIYFATTQNPEIILGGGNWQFSLNASNAVSWDLSDQVTFVNLTIGEIAPLAAFTASRRVLIFPGTVQFTDASTNAPTAWNWSFGDGTYSNVRNASHQYVKRGRWMALLTASNGAGSGTNSTTIWLIGG